MAEIEESLLKRKIDSFSSTLDDFQGECELTVKITLNEYRDLVKATALADYKIKKAEENKYTRDDENKKLKRENKELEMELFEYRKQYGELERNKESEDLENE